MCQPKDIRDVDFATLAWWSGTMNWRSDTGPISMSVVQYWIGPVFRRYQCLCVCVKSIL